MSAERLEIIYELNQLSASEAWDVIRCNLSTMVSPAKIYGSKVDVARISNHLRKSERTGFHLEVSPIVVDYTIITDYEQVLLSIEKAEPQEFAEWQKWSELFFLSKKFVHAFTLNVDYSFWQNAKDPLQYESHGRKYDGLSLKTNGLPPPLDAMIIDVSSNPGRRIIRRGFVEVVSAQNWLGDAFWAVTAKKKNLVIGELNKAGIEYHDNEFLYIQASPRQFSEHTERTLQDTLRRIMFE